MDIEIIARQFYEYSSFIRGYSQQTISRYKHIINYYRRHAGITLVTEVTEENVKALFFHGRVEKSWKPNSFICYHKSLLVFFRWCVDQKYLKKNPVEDIEIPRLQKRIPPKLTKQEALKLLEIVYNYPYPNPFFRYRNHAMFSMFLFAGLRKTELLNLKYADVDIENLTVFVRQGKGSKDRIVPMSYTLAQTLKSYLDHRKKLNKTCPEFFTSYRRDNGMHEKTLLRLIKRTKKISRVTFSCHKLRHTFATLMLEGGCDIYSLSKMMGHSDIKTTTIYLAASAEHLRSQITKHPLNTMI